MSSLARIKYLIFSPWEVSEKGPYNKYHSGQFHHTARQLMASFALTETLQMPGLWHVSSMCLSQTLDLGGQGTGWRGESSRCQFPP